MPGESTRRPPPRTTTDGIVVHYFSLSSTMALLDERPSYVALAQKDTQSRYPMVDRRGNANRANHPVTCEHTQIFGCCACVRTCSRNQHYVEYVDTCRRPPTHTPATTTTRKYAFSLHLVMAECILEEPKDGSENFDIAGHRGLCYGRRCCLGGNAALWLALASHCH